MPANYRRYLPDQGLLLPRGNRTAHVQHHASGAHLCGNRCLDRVPSFDAFCGDRCGCAAARLADNARDEPAATASVLMESLAKPHWFN